jgi:hypothetical protein
VEGLLWTSTSCHAVHWAASWEVVSSRWPWTCCDSVPGSYRSEFDPRRPSDRFFDAMYICSWCVGVRMKLRCSISTSLCRCRFPLLVVMVRQCSRHQYIRQKSRSTRFEIVGLLPPGGHCWYVALSDRPSPPHMNPGWPMDCGGTTRIRMDFRMFRGPVSCRWQPMLA